ncbi:MAG: protein-disulfide reductase DsbD domain-containing protein [Wenzhouxiangella sp.]|nr:protein-disulfide reductase DsbD domain-containing protein [Wenzhouxiangella sp.]
MLLRLRTYFILKLVTVLFFALTAGAGIARQSPETGAVQRPHIEVELVSETLSIQSGEPFRVGLRMLPEQGWHTYWINPGDSGLPIVMDWTLEAGTEVSQVDWPYPQRLPIGHLVNYGYEGEHLLPVTITPPAGLSSGEDFTIDLYADWLVCKVECIPGDAHLRLTLPVRDQVPPINPRTKSLFEWADRRLPEAAAWDSFFSTDGGQLSIQVEIDRDLPSQGWLFFPAEENIIDHAESSFITFDGGLIQISTPLSTYFTGAPDELPFVLVHPDTGTAFSLKASADSLISDLSISSAESSNPHLALLLLMALIGGVLLNLMPCVFPVLSIKALTLANHSDRNHRAHGLAYTAGVVLSFVILASILLALRAGGQALGWGFQLQSPWLVGALVYLFFIMGLGLSGLYTFGAQLMGVGERWSGQEGLKGSFFTGVLACIVASPCTAPFMGTALGIAVLLAWPVALLIFATLGLGLALPLLMISYWPAFSKRLPRPGPWMETFRQAMAFPLYLAAVWLLWVFARQTDANGVALLLCGLVALGFAIWVGRLKDRGQILSTMRHVSVALCLLFAFAALASAARLQPNAAEPASEWWEPWSVERLEQLNNDPEQAVLVNMTADWCVTCLVNERVALNTDAVRTALLEHDVVYLKGDWTRRDPAITQYLAEFRRNGVPLYVVYPRSGGPPQVLPQVLTPAIVVGALESL